MSLLLGGSVAALVITNPTKEDYTAHAGTQLVSLATNELCYQRTLPLVLQIWIKDCPRLIADQEVTLASLASQFTRRWNLGLASIYLTTVGGQDLLPTLRLPRYSVTTLGGAGGFLVLHTQSDTGRMEGRRRVRDLCEADARRAFWSCLQGLRWSHLQMACSPLSCIGKMASSRPCYLLRTPRAW